MRKKICFKLIVLFLLLVIFVVILLFFNKIELIKNVKHAMLEYFSKISDTFFSEENNEFSDITIIDVTGLSSGNGFEHDCQNYLISNYDETNHWNECRLCHKKYDMEIHNFADNGWTMGTANNCSEDNKHIFLCQCGYTYSNTIGKRAHEWTYCEDSTSFSKYHQCNLCSIQINKHECRKSDGSRITCSNLGVCVTCGTNYTRTISHSASIKGFKGGIPGNTENADMICYICENINMGHVNYNYIEKISDNVYKWYISVENIGNYRREMYVSSFGNVCTVTNNGSSINGTTWTNEETITFNSKVESPSTSKYRNKFNRNTNKFIITR